MTFEQLLKEEELLLEKKLATLNKRKKKKEEIANDGDRTVELSPEMKRKLRAHKHPDWQDDGGKKFKPGRERTVAAVRNLCKRKGKSVSTGQVRDYIYKKFVQWDNHDKEADWMLKLEKHANDIGYNPRQYAHAKKGDTVGLGGPGDPEYNGRAYFFTGLINGFANHFLKGGDKKHRIEHPIHYKRKEHKKAVKARKAEERSKKDK